MLRTRLIVPLVTLSLGAAFPCLGQGVGRDCSLAGTWYGVGEGAKYLMTIIPSRAGEYVSITVPGFVPKVPALYGYSGTIVMKSATAFISQAVALANKSALPPLPGSPSLTPEIWAVRVEGQLVDCDTLEMEGDFWAAYMLTSNKVPFRDPPDYLLLQPPATMRETYRRMPTDCPACPVVISGLTLPGLKTASGPKQGSR